MDDVLQRLSDQSVQAREVAAQWEQTGRVSAGSGGPVTIIMDFDGRLVEARLHSHWRRRLASGDLGAAVVSAVQEAQRLLLTDEVRKCPRAAKHSPDEPATNETAQADPADFASYLRTLLIDVQVVLPQVAAHTLHAANEETVIKGANGAVVASARGGTLTRLTCARAWLARTGHAEISRILTEVLVRAMPGETARMRAGMDAVGRVAEFRALMADPARLLANLGLVSGVRDERA